MRIFSQKKTVLIYILSLVALFLYSFTQISLSLALVRYPAIYSIQQWFQHIGYFDRPLSTYIFLVILVGMFSSYFLFLKNAKTIFRERSLVWKLIFATAILLFFSFPAFSNDIFNYIFDAKIFTFYGKNPYQYKALDFPNDPMLSFMHWTHRTYPYGPVWLLLSIPISYIGFQIFLITLFLFKILAVCGYLGSIYFLGKIMEKIDKEKEILTIIFFAFNPLVIIESLVSAHHDIIMIFFALACLHYLIEKRYIVSFIFFLLSIGIKFVTIFMFPVFLAIVVMQMLKEKIPWNAFIGTLILCMFLGVLGASRFSGNFQPWYLIFVVPFIALVVKNVFYAIPAMILSIGGLLTYVPYLYLGNWDKPVPDYLRTIYLVSTGFCIASIFLLYKKKRDSKT